jgi:phosphoserine aminotransferase
LQNNPKEIETLIMRRIYNFSAGPAILPVPVLEEASRGVLDIQGSGMSILEVSHRGKEYDAIHVEAQANLLKVLNLSPDAYAVMFLGGGASLQFALLPMNFLGNAQTADYVDSGEWSAKAIKEAERFGDVHIAGSSAGSRYDRLPGNLRFSEGARYAHVTTNNTIEGTQFHALPDAGGAPLTADMSSDIFAVERDFSKFALFYAGAQKNAGPAGVTLAVVRRDFLETASRNVPPMLSYRVQVEKESLYNTPPVFPIYVVNLVLKWIQGEGGVAALHARNREKAGILYAALDGAPEFFRPTVADKADRSWMNVTFRLADETLEPELLAEAKRQGMEGLKGHRNVGGFRASIYNAFPREGVQALADLLREFAQKRG